MSIKTNIDGIEKNILQIRANRFGKYQFVYNTFANIDGVWKLIDENLPHITAEIRFKTEVYDEDEGYVIGTYSKSTNYIRIDSSSGQSV